MPKVYFAVISSVEALISNCELSRMIIWSSNCSTSCTFGIRQSNEMGEEVLYAEPSLQGNNVIARRQTGDNETTINLELLFNAATAGKLK